MCWIKVNQHPALFVSGNWIYSGYAHSGSRVGLTITGYPDYYTATNQWYDSIGQIRSYQQTKLLQPLTAGTTYYYSMYVGAAIDSFRDILANIGVYFSTTKLSAYQNSGRVHVVPQISFTNWTLPIASLYSFHWVKLTGSFVAIGGEQYMTLGNFDSATNFNLAYASPLTQSGGFGIGMLYAHLFDDLSLVSDTTQPMISLGNFSLGPDTILCPGDSIILGGEPHFFHYWWNTGDTTRFITANQPGTYWCTVDFGCSTYTDTVRILPPPPVAPFTMPDTAGCFPGTLVLTPPSGVTGLPLWSTGASTDTVAVTAPGLYWLQVSDGCSISFRDSFTVSHIPAMVAPFTLPDAYLCNPAGVALAGPPAQDQYLWSTGDTTATILATTPGTYWLRISNACNSSYTDTLSVLPAVTAISLGSDTVVCNAASSLTVTLPTGLDNILWSTGSAGNSIAVSQPGTYWVQATSPCGKFYDTVRIGFCPPAIQSLSLLPDTLCQGDCLLPTAVVRQYPQRYEWAFLGGQPDAYAGTTPPPVCYDSVGMYSVRLVVFNAGGADSAQSMVAVLPKPAGRFRDTALTIPYETILLLPACADAAQRVWHDSRGKQLCDGCGVLKVEAKKHREQYTCVLRNADACADSCTYTVTVTGIPTDIFLPSAFSPNGDGRNDVFRLITSNPNVRVEHFQVVNRWGQSVFHAVQNEEGWDGDFGGMPAPGGVYFWLLRYRVDGVEGTFSLKGDVTIVR